MSTGTADEVFAPTFERTFDVQLTERDGRTVYGRCVPYNVVAEVSDGGPRYQEMFLPGSIVNAQGRMDAFLDVHHERGFRGVVGHNVSVEERPDGLHAGFRLLKHADGEKALELVRAGVLTGFSVSFRDLQNRIVGGVTQRVRAHVDRVALCMRGAYPEAQVLAVRTPPEPVLERPVFDEFDPELATRLARYVDLPVELRLLDRAFSDSNWDGSPGRWPDPAAYCRASLIDDNPAGATKTKALCHLPIREPGSGAVNVNAVRNALARVDQVQTSDANKARAKRTLERLLAQFNTAAGSS